MRKAMQPKGDRGHSFHGVSMTVTALDHPGMYF